jgi:hypothetical protein
VIWLPVIFICMAGECQFLAGDIEWSQPSCYREVVVAVETLREQGITATGTCIEIRVT